MPQRARSVIGDPLGLLESLVEKHLTQNQVLGMPARAQPEPANDELSRLHQLVHQRLRTTMDILGPEPGDEVRSWTNCRWWRGAACDYGSHGSSHVPSADQYPRCGDGRKGAIGVAMR
jgi:hypothetical protein